MSTLDLWCEERGALVKQLSTRSAYIEAHLCGKLLSFPLFHFHCLFYVSRSDTLKGISHQMGLMSVIEGGEVRRRVDSSTLSQ